MIPQEILSQGAQVVYGWLHYRACRADSIGLTYGRWTYPPSGGPAVEHPTGARMRRLAERLFALRNKVGRLLTLHQGRYLPWNGV